MALFGKTSKQWREEQPELGAQGYNIRDTANIPQLTVLSNIESYNSILIKEGKTPKERLGKLKELAVHQLKTFSEQKYIYPIESPLLAQHKQLVDLNQNFKDQSQEGKK